MCNFARVGVLGVLTLPLAGLTSAPALAHPSGCTFRDVQYALTSGKLQERIAARWNYTPDLGDRAQLQTVQTARADWHGRVPKAAFFYELSGQCRIGDWHQGVIRATVPVATHVDGTWSAGRRSGTCTNDRLVSRSLPVTFIRQTPALEPPAPRIGLQWSLPEPRVLDCPFTAFDPQAGEYHPGHLDGIDLVYDPLTEVVSKTVLVGRSKVARLSVHLRSHAHPVFGGLAPWGDGQVAASLELRATDTLERSSDCTVLLGTPGASRC
jgi:hypothetical protein